MGSRLLATDQKGRIQLLEPGGQAIARSAGFSWQVGDRVTPQHLDKMAEWMAQAVLSAVRDDSPPEEVQDLFLTRPLSLPKRYNGIVFSGGVGEYVYGKEGRSYGDLGRALRERTSDGSFPWPLLPARECIRATVAGTVGASLKEERRLANEVLSIDGIVLRDFDFMIIDWHTHVYPPEAAAAPEWQGRCPMTLENVAMLPRWHPFCREQGP